MITKSLRRLRHTKCLFQRTLENLPNVLEILSDHQKAQRICFHQNVTDFKLTFEHEEFITINWVWWLTKHFKDGYGDFKHAADDDIEESSMMLMMMTLRFDMIHLNHETASQLFSCANLSLDNLQIPNLKSSLTKMRRRTEYISDKELMEVKRVKWER